MKKLILAVAATITFISCGDVSEKTTLSSTTGAIKGEGWFKNGYLFSISSEETPEDRCWYHNSQVKKPLDKRSELEIDKAALQGATPLLSRSITDLGVKDAIEIELSRNKSQQTRTKLGIGAICTGITVKTTTLTTVGTGLPASLAVAGVVCPALATNLVALLEDATRNASVGQGAIDAVHSGDGIQKTSKDAVNLFKNALTNANGNGKVRNCAKLLSNQDADFFDRIVGQNPAMTKDNSGDLKSCSVYVVTSSIAAVYTGNSNASTQLDNGIGKGIILDRASPYDGGSRVFVKPRAGSTYSGQGVWVDASALSCK